MNQQSGWTLIYALIFLAMITVITVYALDRSNVQSKMVANSLFTTLTYQECRNEQEAQLLRFNNSKDELANLLDIAGLTNEQVSGDEFSGLLDDLNTVQTTIINTTQPESDLSVNWSYIKDAPAAGDGFEVDTESQQKRYLYETTCNATFNLTSNNQTLGAIVSGLRQSGILN